MSELKCTTGFGESHKYCPDENCEFHKILIERARKDWNKCCDSPSEHKLHVENEILKERIDKLRETLEFYADTKNWNNAEMDEFVIMKALFVRPDYGEKIKCCGEGARKALRSDDEMRGKI